MFGRISRGWLLMKQSWSVLRLDKELMLFPILSSAACLFVFASFAAPIALVPQLRESVFAMANAPAGGQGQGVQARLSVPAVVTFCFYLVNYFVIVFEHDDK